MATPHATSNGSRCSLTPDQRRSVEATKLDQVEPSRVSADDPQYQRLRNWGPIDLHLLPSHRLRMQDIDPWVQPTDNPYHWEVPQNRNSNISTWVKASWTRTNEIVRQGAGTLNRKVAVRRSRNEGKPQEANGANGSAHPKPSVAKLTLHRSYSFEDQRSRAGSDTILEEIEEGGTLETITRVDSGIIAYSSARAAHFREEMEEQPVIARTFSEILGIEAFVPTALLEEK